MTMSSDALRAGIEEAITAGAWTKQNLIARLHVLRLIGKAKPAKVAVKPTTAHLCSACDR
jgi:hypothetical protein